MHHASMVNGDYESCVLLSIIHAENDVMMGHRWSPLARHKGPSVDIIVHRNAKHNFSETLSLSSIYTHTQYTLYDQQQLQSACTDKRPYKWRIPAMHSVCFHANPLLLLLLIFYFESQITRAILPYLI